jgi:hypothetical protein
MWQTLTESTLLHLGEHSGYSCLRVYSFGVLNEYGDVLCSGVIMATYLTGG